MPKTVRKATKPLSIAYISATAAISVSLSACGGGDDSLAAVPPAARCPALAGTNYPAGAFGLSTGGATLKEATLVPADTATGAPEYCKVTGSIAAAAASDLPIQFQVNLPSDWNAKTVQFGGGGSNGIVITGTGNVTAAGSARTPLARGYVTFGGDSGHAGSGREFYLNAQATANYGNESVKKTKDLATAVLASYYKATAKRNYYIGGSKGGQEGLHAAQRYAADFDGVVAYYPAAQNPPLILAWFRMWEAAYRVPGGALNPAKSALLKTRVLAACDALDGATDGIVGNTAGCQGAFNVQTLRCPGGTDAGDTCLSDPQIATLNIGASPMDFAFPMANGITHIGAFPVYTGGDLGLLFSASGNANDSGFFGFTDGVIRYSWLRDGAASTVGFDYRNYRPQVEDLSRVYDASNPDIDAFSRKGGKLLLVQGTTDMLVPPAMTTDYFNKLSARYGNQLASFARYYLVPGFGHGFGDFNMQWDSLTALDEWVENGRAPVNPIATDGSAATRGRTRPMCEYPTWPRYNGTGDLNSAASYTCAAS